MIRTRLSRTLCVGPSDLLGCRGDPLTCVEPLLAVILLDGGARRRRLRGAGFRQGATASSPQACCASAPRACTRRSATTIPSGQLVGYDVDIAKAVGDKLGVKVEFVETPWDSMFAALEANRFDIVANQVTINAERKAKYDLSDPYAIGEGVIVTRADDNSIKSLADLKGKVAAENRHQQLGATRPRRRRPRRVRRRFRPGHQAAEPGPRRRRRQRQHRRVPVPRRDRRQVGQDRRGRRARRASRASPRARTAACCPN